MVFGLHNMLQITVSCLFARGVYGEPVLSDCLRSIGYTTLAERFGEVSSHAQRLRWQTRLRTGFDPRMVTIPKRFLEVETWKGRIDGAYLNILKTRMPTPSWCSPAKRARPTIIEGSLQ
jgi:aldehyde:ferredoxin oxidoreductase